jgi:hypothetical protein
MAATLRQRQKAAEVLRAGGTHAEAAKAAGVSVSTISLAAAEGSQGSRVLQSLKLRKVWRSSGVKRSSHGFALPSQVVRRVGRKVEPVSWGRTQCKEAGATGS